MLHPKASGFGTIALGPSPVVIALMRLVVDHTSGSGVAHASDVHALIGQSTLVTVPGAGHAVLIERPDIGSRTINDFIASQPA